MFLMNGEQSEVDCSCSFFWHVKTSAVIHTSVCVGVCVCICLSQVPARTSCNSPVLNVAFGQAEGLSLTPPLLQGLCSPSASGVP